MNLIYGTVDWLSEKTYKSIFYIAEKAENFGENVPFIGLPIEIVVNIPISIVLVITSIAFTIIGDIGERFSYFIGSEKCQVFFEFQKGKGVLVGLKGKALVLKCSDIIGKKVDALVQIMKIFGNKVPFLGKVVEHGVNGMIGLAQIVYYFVLNTIGDSLRRIGEIIGNRPLQILGNMQERSSYAVGEKGVVLISATWEYLKEKSSLIAILAGAILFFVGHLFVGGGLVILGLITFIKELQDNKSDQKNQMSINVQDVLTKIKEETRGSFLVASQETQGAVCEYITDLVQKQTGITVEEAFNLAMAYIKDKFPYLSRDAFDQKDKTVPVQTVPSTLPSKSESYWIGGILYQGEVTPEIEEVKKILDQIESTKIGSYNLRLDRPEVFEYTLDLVRNGGLSNTKARISAVQNYMEEKPEGKPGKVQYF